MKACSTVTGAMGIATASGVIAGVLSAIALQLTAPPWTGIGAVVACLVVGLFTLIAKYPRWQADI
jgi:hypothetical protein